MRHRKEGDIDITRIRVERREDPVTTTELWMDRGQGDVDVCVRRQDVHPEFWVTIQESDQLTAPVPGSPEHRRGLHGR